MLPVSGLMIDTQTDVCQEGADWQEEHAISLVLPSVRFGKFLVSLLLAPDYSHTEARHSAHWILFFHKNSTEFPCGGFCVFCQPHSHVSSRDKADIAVYRK